MTGTSLMPCSLFSGLASVPKHSSNRCTTNLAARNCDAVSTLLNPSSRNSSNGSRYLVYFWPLNMLKSFAHDIHVEVVKVSYLLYALPRIPITNEYFYRDSCTSHD